MQSLLQLSNSKKTDFQGPSLVKAVLFYWILDPKSLEMLKEKIYLRRKSIKFIIFEYFIAVKYSARFQEVGFSWQKVS